MTSCPQGWWRRRPTLIENWLAGDNGAIQSLGNPYRLVSGKCGEPLTAFKAEVAAQLRQGDLTPEQAETLLELADVICDVFSEYQPTRRNKLALRGTR